MKDFITGKIETLGSIFSNETRKARLLAALATTESILFDLLQLLREKISNCGIIKTL